MGGKTTVVGVTPVDYAAMMTTKEKQAAGMRNYWSELKAGNRPTRRFTPRKPAPFWSRVKKSAGRNSCWLWVGALSGDGYGSVRTQGCTRGAHRVAWEEAHGPVPRGCSVLHKCDVPQCVRLSHLFLGTQTDNMADASRKGRLAGRKSASGEHHGSHTHPESVRRGARNGAAVLTEQQVAAIRAAYPMKTQKKLAQEYSVDQVTISRIVRRVTYK
jgi:hypothetical protein